MKSIISTIKEHLSIIALVPLILGGLWQILELALISTSYIRFFSVTQQLADGLLILFILVMFYLLYLFLNKSVFSGFKKVDEYADNSTRSLVLSIFGFIIVFLTMMLFSASTILRLPNTKNDILNGNISLADIIFQLFVVAYTSVPIIGIIFFLSALIKKKTKIRLQNNSDTVILAKAIVSFLFVVFGLFLLGTIIPIFHSAYTIPKNLKNISYLIEKYSKSDSSINKSTVKIIYMNDKYIFIKDSSKIEVVKFDYMFKGEK